MEYERVDNLVRQRVLLVEQHSDEEGVGPSVVHLGEVGNCGTGVNHGDGGFGEDGREDGCLLERAGGLD